MPKRSNEFQRLIHFIEMELAGEDESVTKSKLFSDSVSGEPREVDIVIEIDRGVRSLVVGIECTASTRPVGSKLVEEIHTKHSHLPIDKSVIVSRSGFTGPARKKAGFLNVQLLGIEESQDPTWLDQVRRTRVAFFATQPPRLITVRVNFDKRHPDLQLQQVDPYVWPLYRSEAQLMGTMAQVAVAVLEQRQFVARTEDYRPDLACFDVFADLEFEERIYTISPAGNEIDVAGLEITAVLDVEVGTVELAPGQYGPASIAHGTGQSESFGMEIRAVQSSAWVPGQPIEVEYQMTLPKHLSSRKVRHVQVSDSRKPTEPGDS